MNPARASACQAGFSLVELMVALAIAGLAATAVVIALPGGMARPALAAERFAARLAAARDSAVIDGQPVACTIDAMGYAFARRRNGAWVPPSDRRLQRQAWPAGLAIALPAERPRRLVFDAMGMPSDPFAAVLSADGTARRVSVARDGTVRVNAAP